MRSRRSSRCISRKSSTTNTMPMVARGCRIGESSVPAMVDRPGDALLDLDQDRLLGRGRIGLRRRIAARLRLRASAPRGSRASSGRCWRRSRRCARRACRSDPRPCARWCCGSAARPWRCRRAGRRSASPGPRRCRAPAATEAATERKRPKCQRRSRFTSGPSTKDSRIAMAIGIRTSRPTYRPDHDQGGDDDRRGQGLGRRAGGRDARGSRRDEGRLRGGSQGHSDSVFETRRAGRRRGGHCGVENDALARIDPSPGFIASRNRDRGGSGLHPLHS